VLKGVYDESGIKRTFISKAKLKRWGYLELWSLDDFSTLMWLSGPEVKEMLNGLHATSEAEDCNPKLTSKDPMTLEVLDEIHC
jgi:hypothetical protein